MMTKEQFRQNKDRFEQAEAFEQVHVSYSEYYGKYHIVAEKWVLERLENVAKATADAIYKDLGVENESEVEE